MEKENKGFTREQMIDVFSGEQELTYEEELELMQKEKEKEMFKVDNHEDIPEIWQGGIMLQPRQKTKTERIQVMTTKPLKKAIQRHAKKNKTSVNDFINKVVEAYILSVEKQEKKK